MWLVYGVWTWFVVSTFYKWYYFGDLAAANHIVPALLLVCIVHGGALLYRKYIKKPEITIKNNETDKDIIQNSRANDSSLEDRLSEERVYAAVAEEVKSEKIRAGLMAKAVAEADGNKDREMALYIKYRVQSIKDERDVAERQARYEEKKEHFEQAAKNLAEAEKELLERQTRQNN